MPSLSLYYGIVLSLGSSPHSSVIRLKLHPSCRLQTNAEGEDDTLNAEGEIGEEPRYPKYFGEDLEAQRAEEEEPDIKTITLDDIVDCRRIVLA